jgi:hypothetical protein
VCSLDSLLHPLRTLGELGDVPLHCVDLVHHVLEAAAARSHQSDCQLRASSERASRAWPHTRRTFW